MSVSASPPGAVRGRADFQLSNPTVSFPAGSVSQVMVHVWVRAVFHPDDGAGPLPEPIHGEVQPLYSVRPITLPDGRRVLRVRASSDDNQLRFLSAAPLTAADAQEISRRVRTALRTEFVPVDVELDPQFAFAEFRGLGGGVTAAVALPVQLSGGPAPAGGLSSVTNHFLGSSEFAIAVSKDYVQGFLDTVVQKMRQAAAGRTFSAAGATYTASVSPDAPFDLEATAVSEFRIDLTWKHNSVGGVKFIVSFRGPDLVWNENYATVTEKSFSSMNLTEGLTYSYRVRATLAPGNDSGPSNEVTTRTWRWETAYSKPLATNDGVFAGDCLVQRIDKALLAYSGTGKKVRLTVRGSANPANAALAIDRLSISHPASPTPDNSQPQVWDSAASSLKQLPGTSLPGDGTPVVLAPIDFPLDKTQDLSVAFDINASNLSPTRKVTAGVGTSTAYIRNNTIEAAAPNRTPPGVLTSGNAGWNDRPGVFLVERIEVLTA